MMRSTQLALDFGKSLLRHIQSKPEPPAPASSPKRSRDHDLEKLSVQLLRAAGCSDLQLQVCWNPRLRTTAGQACWRTKTITLNPKLFDVSPAEVQRTLRHELAHFLAQHRAGRRRIPAHGNEWRLACLDLGIPREPRCHDLPFKRARMERKYFYVCRSCGSKLARVRPVKSRVACLKCCRKHSGGKYDDRFRFVAVNSRERLAT